MGMTIPDVRFRQEIESLAAEDRSAPPPGGSILFVGDSDVRLWSREGRFAEDFAGLPVVNRGFGGARTWEVLIYYRQLILPCRPRVIVYCCGDNDIVSLGEPGVRSAVTGFRLFLDLARKHSPQIERILYLAIHPSPADAPLWGCIRQANEELRELCAASGPVEFVDYLHLLLDEQMKPRPELFQPDGLHFTPRLYRELAVFIRPLLEGVAPSA